ncbi:MAG: hypothetical protein UW30_C0001G0014 [Candidatus Giovannonibacteria bacterium GW2011_GWA2_44_13b]|uniref:Uncharacterized protein n=1 Tax=Candidatus Giovannonibacteria bacterium GW2011_GWA2_44_13b TaxID=1618647 RepID=A0A0G1K3A3_9BACT|nr:MAG: hypothetical protein UW30_C0001G0014 [Candidatus Giovannonibacteria bacterium GW2011_GWA2_44_13b]
MLFTARSMITTRIATKNVLDVFTCQLAGEHWAYNYKRAVIVDHLIIALIFYTIYQYARYKVHTGK